MGKRDFEHKNLPRFRHGNKAFLQCIQCGVDIRIEQPAKRASGAPMPVRVGLAATMASRASKSANGARAPRT